MDQLTEMRVFVRAIERGTFAAAAGDQGLTPSAVSKLIRRLESRLGVRLINRTTRKLSLTSEGETYFHSGRRLIEAVDGLEDEVAASAGHPRGLLRINTENWWGVQYLAPALIDFQQRYPDVRVCLSLTDRLVDLYAE
jgi:DNA-binding transcriptional LysR family regulator